MDLYRRNQMEVQNGLLGSPFGHGDPQTMFDIWRFQQRWRRETLPARYADFVKRLEAARKRHGLAF